MANPFQTSAMTAGYANARPPVHARVMELARDAFLAAGPVHRALDIGCGAGISTRALLPFGEQIYGLEPVASMAQLAPMVAPGARFVCAAAEALPFPDQSFHLLTAAGSLNYTRLEVFFPEARRVLSSKGRLLVYDFSAGRSFPGNDALDRWFESFQSRYPPVASEATVLDPEILAAFPSGFTAGPSQRFELALDLTPEFYLDYMLTETNVAAAIRRGVPESEIRRWCEETLRPIWQGQPRKVLFRGYWALLLT